MQKRLRAACQLSSQIHNLKFEKAYQDTNVPEEGFCRFVEDVRDLVLEMQHSDWTMVSTLGRKSPRSTRAKRIEESNPVLAFLHRDLPARTRNAQVHLEGLS